LLPRLGGLLTLQSRKASPKSRMQIIDYRWIHLHHRVERKGEENLKNSNSPE
jgi:hypothetical protein